MASSSLVDQPPPSDLRDDHAIRTYTDMDTAFYIAAACGAILDVFGEMRHQLANLLTPNKNTVLHLHISATSPAQHPAFVEKILELCPALLTQANTKGDMPLHLAARYGHTCIVESLINRAKADIEVSGDEAAKQMLRAGNGEGDTALHEAVRFRHLSIVRLLTKEDADFSYPANEVGETPLYIAAERRYSELVAEILDNCASPAAGGPCGRTALHAATIAKDEASTEKILRKMQYLTRTTDDNGWTPLHYAANLKRISIVKLLLKFDTNAFYVRDTQGRTAHHVAALCGHHEILRELMMWRPGCCELVDVRGCNILHLAVESDSRETVIVILSNYLFSHLLYEKNKDGNTPLHHAAALHRPASLDALMSSPRYVRVDKEAFNGENKNVRDIIFTDDRICPEKLAIRCFFALFYATKFGQRILNRKDEDNNWQLDEHDPRKKDQEEGKEDPTLPVLEKGREASMIAATLIATVTFTAGFTLPGGYVSDSGPLQGAAVLRHKAAFKAFMITDTIAMVLSSLAVFLHLYLALTGPYNKRKLENNFFVAFYLTTLSIGAMIVAFVTGTYAALEHFDLLANATCALGLSFFVFFVFASYRNESKSGIKKLRNQIYYKIT